MKEIEVAIAKLSQTEIEELRAWIEDFLEDQAEVSDTVKARIEESRREIAQGNYTRRAFVQRALSGETDYLTTNRELEAQDI